MGFPLPKLTILILLLGSLHFMQADNLGRTPYCEKCKCVNESMSNPDVDCSQTAIGLEFYEEKYYSNNGTFYTINTLSLQENGLREIGKQFPSSTLKKLDLSHNYIKTIVDLAFANLKEIREIDLSYNNLDTVNQNFLRGNVHVDGLDYPLKNLRILRLDGNKIHSLDDNAFQYIDGQLEVLSLSNNPIKILDTSTHIAITGIVNLKVLDLSYTEITGLPSGMMHTPKHLQVLNLSGNKFSSVPQELGNCHTLETLYLDNTQITRIENKTVFPKMPTLKVLYLRENANLEVLGANSLSGLENLSELYITHSSLEKIDAGAFSRHEFANEVYPPLKKLSLNNNKLQRIDMHVLESWDHLIFIDLRHNSWICDCENQWMLDSLMPIYAKMNESHARELICESPVEMQDKVILDLANEHKELRCLDMFGNRPEKDGTMLVVVLTVMLIGIPLVLFILYAIQKNCFGFFDNSPAAFSRTFYRQTRLSEDLE